jgi:hypothetical protein
MSMIAAMRATNMPPCAVFFIAICGALGFGPDEWASFMITGLPHWVTPELARLVFVSLGFSVFVVLAWTIIQSRKLDSGTTSHLRLRDNKLDQTRRVAPKRPSIPDGDVRIPYVQIRQLANTKGWSLNDDSTACVNRAYYLEGQMQQAAVEGSLLFWGRKCEAPIESKSFTPYTKETL